MRTLAAFGLAGAVALGASSRSQEAPLRYVNVQAVGSAEWTPTHAEMRAVVSAQAEVASEAWEAFLQMRLRTLAAFASLEIDGLEVTTMGHSVAYAPPLGENPQMAHVHQQMDPLEGAHFWEIVKVVVPLPEGVSEEARGQLAVHLVDTAIDGGLMVIGGQANPNNYQPRTVSYDGRSDTPVRWILPDRSAVEAAAREDALARAEAEARHTAQAAGGRLGSINMVNLQPAQDVYTHRVPTQYLGNLPQGALIEEVPYNGVVQVRANVRYDLE